MLSSFDWTIICIYFLILLGIVLSASRRQKTTTDYFLAGRNVGFLQLVPPSSHPTSVQNT